MSRLNAFEAEFNKVEFIRSVEGTMICAKAMPNALAVPSMSERGGLPHALDTSMKRSSRQLPVSCHLLHCEAPP